MNYAQGEETRFVVNELTQAISDVGSELNSIGINYNQEVRLYDIEKKLKVYGNTAEFQFEDNLIKNSNCGFDKSEVKNFFDKYNATANMVAELTSLIQ